MRLLKQLQRRKTMTKIYNISEQSGRSMVEMLGVLAIVGVLSIGGIAGYSKAMAKYKVNKTIDQVSMLITNIRIAYGNQNSYKDISNQKLVEYELVSNDITQGSTDGTFYNPYAGTITVTPTDTSGTACNSGQCPAFSITYTNLDRQACAAIASSDWGGSASSGLLSMTVKAGDKTAKHDWTTANASDPSKRLPIDFNQAMTDCGTFSTQSSITWVYY